jgi:GntR family transcriptional regulator, transcriptional repressor for pyruvate dehydrogenase complex
MARFKPVRQLRVSEEIVAQLKESILLGHFKPGDKLPPERDLAQEFQVSRVAIREALRKLENTGFIATRQGATGGAYVTDLTFEHLAKSFLDLFMANKISIPEMHQVRILVEPEVARLAALKVTPEYVQRLKDSLEAEELPISSLSEDVERKQRVHFILAEMCDNRFLEALVGSLMRLTRRAVEAVEANPHHMHPAGMHRPIVEAVLKRDAEAAAEAMEKHTIEFGEILIEMEKAYREKKSMLSFFKLEPEKRAGENR